MSLGSVRTSAILVFLVLGCLLLPRSLGALPADPAARGLDVFVHVPRSAAPGAQIELTAEAIGFATVTHALPLPNATIEVGWDPETLDGTAAPPSATARTDASGHAKLSLDVPAGTPRDLALLFSVRHGPHARTRTVTVARAETALVELHTADLRVVPTSTVAAWVRVAAHTGLPIANARATIELLEGGVPRHREEAVTDAGGLVMTRVPIPRIDEPVWKWTLRASTELPGSRPAEITLTPREETPGKPTLTAAFRPPPSGVFPGDRIPFELRLRDATGQPVASHLVRYWIGPKSTTPPKSVADWEKASTRAATDGAGEVLGARDAPTLVKAQGTTLTLIARTEVEGHVLSESSDVVVGTAAASAELVPESTAIVPGLTQRVFLRIRDGRGEGVQGPFTIRGDGLSTTLTTDRRGEAEFPWTVPAEIGALRNVGPCAGGVAAAVSIRPDGDLPSLGGRRTPFSVCVAVDRDSVAVARVEPEAVRPGDRVKITVSHARGAKRAYSIVAVSRDHARASASWTNADGDESSSAELVVPADAPPGLWDVSAASTSGATRVATVPLLVVPTTMPLLEARRVGGRATPGGLVEIEARLTDGHGRGLPGTVSSIVVDEFGGGHAAVASLDTRSRLCAAAGAPGDRCTAVLEGDPTAAPLRRSLFAQARGTPLDPSLDPLAHTQSDLKKSFAAVLRSLEGAIFEATASPDALRDVRRHEGRRWVWNPELLTLVTDAMSEPPLTPGGEAITLADLSQIDPQVTFDTAARRVTRLKLFRILSALRQVRVDRALDPEEPVFRDPNALVRRLVREGALGQDMLLDPWGGTIQFVRTTAAPVPFLSIARGFELRAPGPDGAIGTADDVRDPFERVVRSGSPYADATDEDRVVDAKWDMVVSDETVRAWGAVIEDATGTALGGEGIGLGGIGTGGGGSGYGSGTGRLGGSAVTRRVQHAIATGDAHWSSPVRTDAEGRVNLSIPLGDAETTWQVALIGVPDGLGPASTVLSVPSDLPLSSRVDAGARWVAGDVVDVRVVVRNRTNAAVRASFVATAEGVATPAEAPTAASKPREVDVVAHGASTVTVRVHAKKAGIATLAVTTSAPGIAADTLRHSWEVTDAGELRARTASTFVEGERAFSVTVDHGYRERGPGRLVLERGYEAAMSAALDALEPDHQVSLEGLVDALDAARHIERWATTGHDAVHRRLQFRAARLGERALGRYMALTQLEATARGEGKNAPPNADWALRERVATFTKAGRSEADEKQACPPEEEDALEVEPAASSEVLPCWGAHVATITRLLGSSEDAPRIARAVLALAERPHRAALTTDLVTRLRSVARLDEGGNLGGRGLGERADRALVYAALLRAHRFGSSAAPADVLANRLALLRDANGGYGSPAATFAVVRALLASQLEGRGSASARVRGAALDKRVEVPRSGAVVVPLPRGVHDVAVFTQGSGVIARLELPLLRLWSRPPVLQGPVQMDVVWPAEAKAGATATLRILLHHDREHAADIDAKIPLPPGVSLAAPTPAASQIQGTIALRRRVGREGATVELPLRFALAGRVTVPEATARIARSDSPAATAPARPLIVR